MTDDTREPRLREPHEKDRVPPEEGVVVPADELDRVNDRAPSEAADPLEHEGDLPPRRPTDGPL